MRREPGAASASAASASAASAGAASASAVSASAASTWLRSQARLARGATMALVGFGLANAAVGVMQALSLSHLVGPALLGRRIVDVPLWAGVFAFSALLRSALGLASDARAVAAGAAARRRLRTGFLVAAFARGPHRTPATALTTAVDQIEALDSYFSRWLATATLAWAAPLLVLLAVLPADPVAALAMAAGGACVPLGMALAGLGAAKASQQQFAAMARLQTRFLDRVRGIATIVLAGQAEAEALRLHDAARELARRTMRVLRVAFLSSAVLDAAAVAVLVFLAVRAGLAWRGSGLHPIAAVFGLVLVSEFFAPLRAFAAAYQDRIQANAAATTLGASPEHTAPSAAPPIRTVAASSVTVVFENVDFSWDAARGPALSKLSFRVPPNETTILVGASGSGKSTVIEMMLGFIRPDAGRITINGADLDSLTPAALSRITAWIGQRPALFAGSIRENIRFGQQDTTDGATDRAIEEAALAAGLDAGAAWLPQGLDTLVGEGGYGLSGGQAQRVAIARAFVRNAPLLLLDEPTAHLDPATEADVLDSLKRLAIGRTVIMAAHSSAAMAFGGRRIALDHGHVADVQGVA